jgi:hypothetical protein
MAKLVSDRKRRLAAVLMMVALILIVINAILTALPY